MPQNKEAILFFMPEFGGFHVAAWRQDEAPPNPTMNFPVIRQMVQTAERGKFHACFLADTVVAGFEGAAVAPEALSRTVKGTRFEPLTLLSALSSVTEHIGLLATASTTYTEPFNVARMFASLDHLSGGRAGWNVVTSASTAAAFNFGRDEHMDHSSRYEKSQEFCDIVTGLWDSWEADAFLGDKASGLFFDTDKVHAVNFHGDYLSAAGPLNMARPPQGRPVIAQAGSSAEGREFAARNADVIYTLQANVDQAASFYSQVKQRVAELGRDPDHVKILPALVLVVGRTQQEAAEKLANLDALVVPELGMDRLTSVIDLDLSGADLDGPVPEIPETDVGSKTRQKYFLDLAKRDNLTVRQLMQVAARLGAVAGTSTSIADWLEEWMQAGAADGFNITFADSIASLDIFVDEVIPELQRRGLFHTDYQGSTLRESLGIPEPANQFVLAGSNR